jgi:hypothetical protein
MGLPEWPGGQPHVRYARPDDYDLLARFSCGSRDPWEEEINAIFQAFGRAGEQEEIHIRVAEDATAGQLVAASAFRDDIPFVVGPERRKEVATYIQALGVVEEYRDSRERWAIPGYASLGDFVLVDLLLAIHKHWNEHECVVWSQIATGNLHCQQLVEERGFKPMENHDNGYDTWGAIL